jgi:hypothetical protein
MKKILRQQVVRFLKISHQKQPQTLKNTKISPNSHSRSLSCCCPISPFLHLSRSGARFCLLAKKNGTSSLSLNPTHVSFSLWRTQLSPATLSSTHLSLDFLAGMFSSLFRCTKRNKHKAMKV